MTTKILLLNPFSISLKKHPFMEVENKPVLIDGEFRVYRYFDCYFIHTFKNIVIAERGAINKDLINYVSGKVKPKGIAENYHNFERPKEAMQQGIIEAKKLNFNIV